MTNLFFCFDTEDFTCSYSADAILREAELLRKHGIRGNFNLVGLLCDQLINWGKTDVIEALRHHELAIHSYGHTLHPTICEYTDLEDFGSAYAALIRRETEGVDKIRRVFGDVRMNGACPPGDSKSYVAMYGYADMGVSLYADSVMKTPADRGAFMCNLFHIDYSYSMETSFFTDTEEDLKRLVEWYAQKEYAVLYTHPHIAFHPEHWDKYNYNKCNQHPFGQWVEPARRSPEEIERFFANMERFIELVQADERFNIISYDVLADRIKALPERIIRRSDLPGLRAALSNDFTWIKSPCSLCIADVMLACAEMLGGAEEHTCGKVYGFLTAPYSSEGGFEVTAADVAASAEQVLTGGFLPEAIWVGDRKLGPADWLFAALEVLCGAERSAVVKRAQLPDISEYVNLDKLVLRGSWLHSDEFEDRYLSDRLRWQCWTIRML